MEYDSVGPAIDPRWKTLEGSHLGLGGALLEATTAEAVWSGKVLILCSRTPGGSRQAEELLPGHGV